MIAVWVIVGVVGLLVVVGFATDSKVPTSLKPPASSPQPSQPTSLNRGTVADFVSSHQQESSKAKPCVRSFEAIQKLRPKAEIVDRHIQPSLLTTAQEQQLARFQVLGACSSRGYIPDRVVAGTVFRVEDRGNTVWVIRDNGRVIGSLPPDVAKQYQSMPPDMRYSRVVVAREVNFNDKYGQCFVYPVLPKRRTDCEHD